MVVPFTDRRAYSYVRFSSPQQRSGDSLRRQTERAAAYAKKRGWTLDPLALHDLGISAARGENALFGNLALFLSMVKRGTIPPGSVLIVESIDRISRQGIDEGYEIIKKLLKAGIVLVTLAPEREFDVEATRSLTKGALEIQLILERAAEESATKADRSAQAWVARRRAAANGRPMFRTCPAWLQVVDDRFVVLEPKATAVRKVYALARAGYGVSAITKRLNTDGAPPIATAKRWTASYVARLLGTPAVIGHHLTRKFVGRRLAKDDRGKPNKGELIKNLFPPILSEDDYYATRGAVHSRTKCRGRLGTTATNIFSGLLHDALTGSKLHLVVSDLVNYSSQLGQAERTAFPYRIFEAAVLAELAELNVRDVVPPEDDPDADETAKIATELAAAEARLAELEAELLAGDRSIPTVVVAIRKLEDDRRRLTAELADARTRAASPLGESFAEAKTVLAALATAADPFDARLRCRAALRRIIDRVLCVTVRRDGHRLMWLKVLFVTGAVRDFVIGCRVSRGVKARALWPHQQKSLRFEPDQDPLDLTRPADVQRVVAWLEGWDLSEPT